LGISAVARDRRAARHYSPNRRPSVCRTVAQGEHVTGSTFIAHWYFHLPNFILAALMYTLLGRVLLGLIVGQDSKNYIWVFFCRITDPVVNAISVVTPKAVVPVIVWLFGVVWLFWLRVGLLILFAAIGAVPQSGG